MHGVVADRVWLDRRLGESAEKLEQVGVGRHATQKRRAIDAPARAFCDPVVCTGEALELRADRVHDPDAFVAQEAERRCDGDGREGGRAGRVWAELVQHENPLGRDEIEVPGVPGDVVRKRRISGRRIDAGHGDSSFGPG